MADVVKTGLAIEEVCVWWWWWCVCGLEGGGAHRGDGRGRLQVGAWGVGKKEGGYGWLGGWLGKVICRER